MFNIFLSNTQQIILYIFPKVFCSITLLFNIVLLIRLCLTKTTRTLIYQLKIELIISCILYSIGILIPTTKKIDVQSPLIEKIGCHLQAILCGLSNMVSIILYTTLPYITTQVLIDPTPIEKNPILTRVKISLISWVIPSIFSIFPEIFGEVDFDEYSCWYTNEIFEYIYCGINILVFIVYNIVFFRFKRKIKKFMLENEEFSTNYSKGFININILLIFILIIIGFEIFQTTYGIDKKEDENILYFILTLVSFFLECFCYFLTVFLTCFKKELFTNMCDYPKRKEDDYNERETSMVILDSAKIKKLLSNE